MDMKTNNDIVVYLYNNRKKFFSKVKEDIYSDDFESEIYEIILNLTQEKIDSIKNIDGYITQIIKYQQYNKYQFNKKIKTNNIEYDANSHSDINNNNDITQYSNLLEDINEILTIKINWINSFIFKKYYFEGLILDDISKLIDLSITTLHFKLKITIIEILFYLIKNNKILIKDIDDELLILIDEFSRIKNEPLNLDIDSSKMLKSWEHMLRHYTIKRKHILKLINK